MVVPTEDTFTRNASGSAETPFHEIRTDDRPTFSAPVERIERKIALEEHIESPDFPATGSHPFVREDYFSDVERRLQDYRLRLEGMDKAGIAATIVSLTQPGIEGITEAREAVEIAKRTNDHIADFFVKNAPGRLYGFAAVPLQDPSAAADELDARLGRSALRALLSTATRTSAPRPKADIWTRLPSGSSGTASRLWACRCISTRACLCLASSASMRAIPRSSVHPGASGSKPQLMQCG
jgi:predicted TIM-barrel fold metal-dependent hydrolase